MPDECRGLAPPGNGGAAPEGTAPEDPRAWDQHQHNGRHNQPAVQRTVFATPRAAEFLELRALQAQTGQPAEAFGHVVVKELLDNALDAAETAGRAPVIDIHTRTTDDWIVLVTVSDNGAGIAPATVADLCDFNMLVSDKARYRGPARGAQGNALKTVLGIPFALDVTEPVVIESDGIRHELRVTERAGDVVVAHETTASDRTVGTSVTVPLPVDLDIDAGRWAYGAALVNPHATITAIDQRLQRRRRRCGFLQTVRRGVVEVDNVDVVVAALVRPGRVRGVGAGPYPRDRPHRCRRAARAVHLRVRRPVGQREAEGDPHCRRRCHTPVRVGRA